MYSLLLATSLFATSLLAAPAQADERGDALGKQVATATGDIYDLSRLKFTFIVEAGDTEKARRTHTRDWKAGLVMVEMGGETVRFQSIDSVDPSPGTADPNAHADLWAKVAPGTDPTKAASAWSAWINDSYWLLAAGKVMDGGVTRTVDESGRLVLTFAGVGVTPGDSYQLTIDPDSHRVTAWDFELQSGRKGHFAWTDYQAVGPLNLSMRRATEAGDFVIRFEGVEATP